MMAGWRAGGRCTAGPLGATAASRRVTERVSRCVRQRAGSGEDGVRAQVGWGVSGARPGSRAASGGRQRRSVAAGACAACLNACACREGRVSEGESGERKEMSTF